MLRHNPNNLNLFSWLLSYLCTMSKYSGHHQTFESLNCDTKQQVCQKINHLSGVIAK